MLEAGITIDKVSKFMGHSSITVTIGRYRHLLPGGEAEAAEILNGYHAGAGAGTASHGNRIPSVRRTASQYLQLR